MGKITINQESLKPRKEFKRFPVKSGSNIYRILPPFGELEVHRNYAFKKWTLVWGLKDAETGKIRPFSSPWSHGESRCPVSEYTDKLAEKIAKLQTEYETKLLSKGMDEQKVVAAVREKLRPVNELLRNLKPKTKYIYNACDKSGDVGILELSPTAHTALKREMMSYIKDYSQDPTSLSSERDDSGIWFNFLREGEGFNTKYDVRKNQTKEKTEHGIAFVDDRSALPQHVAENYSSLGYDLHTLYKQNSYDELRAILLQNMTRIIEECPEAAIEGFLPSEAVAVRTHSAPAPVVHTSGRAPVALAFDDEESEAPAPIRSAPTPVAAPAPVAKAVTKSQSKEDLFALADELLNS